MPMPDFDDTLSRRSALARLGGYLTAIVLARPGLASALALKPHEHPEPRPGITAEHVLPDEKLKTAKRMKGVHEAYNAAREYPEIFDGVYCGCDCKGSMGHRSLLVCYESEQPMGCGACQEEAMLVGKLAKEGKGLEEIRAAVDKEYD
jgi:hypothetical protein